jgi:hypothetical protein
MNAEKLREELTTLGWKVYDGGKSYPASPVHGPGTPGWYACISPRVGPDCECNDKPPQIVLEPYIPNVSGEVTVELSLCAQMRGVWWNVKCYSLTGEELLSRFNELSVDLLMFWQNTQRVV